MLHTTVEQEEEILAGGVYHITTLQGSHLFQEQEPIFPQIQAAIEQGITIPLDTIPATTVHPQLSIRTTMAAQQEEINTTTGQACYNPPYIFPGSGSPELITLYLPDKLPVLQDQPPIIFPSAMPPNLMSKQPLPMNPPFVEDLPPCPDTPHLMST